MTVTPIRPEYAEGVDRAAAEQGATDEPAHAPAVRALDAPAPAPLRWIVDGLWPAALLGMLVGDGGAFKSSVAVHIAGAIAGGYRVFDLYYTERRPVLIVSAEDEIDVILMRLEAFIVGHRWDRRKVMENVHIIADDSISLGTPSWIAHLTSEAERIQPGFIVIDPWAEVSGGDENSNTEARPAIKYLRRLGKSVDGAIAVVHHAGKAAEGKRQLDRIRGASALPSASRVILFFEYQPDSVNVENLKMSRAPKLPAFVIKRDIDSDPANRAMWTRAKLTVGSAAVHRQQEVDDFIVTQLQLSSPRSTRTLRELKPRGISNQEVADGCTRLLQAGRIDLTEGKQRAKLWSLNVGSAASSRGNGDAQQLVFDRENHSNHSESESGQVVLSGLTTLPGGRSAPAENGPVGAIQTGGKPPLNGEIPLSEDEIQALIDEQMGKLEERD